MDRKTVILAQFFISLMMAGLMTGLFSLWAHGLSLEWLQIWLRQYATAWPIAFVLSMVVSRIGFTIAARITRPATESQAA